MTETERLRQLEDGLWKAADQLRANSSLAAAQYSIPVLGLITGNLHRPKRYDRILLRTCYLAAHSSLKNSPASCAYYQRKRSQGKSHKQALIALARRRTNVIWAMLRDHAEYREPAARVDQLTA